MGNSNLAKKGVKGVLWSSIERFSAQGSQFILGLALARLLSATLSAERYWTSSILKSTVPFLTLRPALKSGVIVLRIPLTRARSWTVLMATRWPGNSKNVGWSRMMGDSTPTGIGGGGANSFFLPQERSKRGSAQRSRERCVIGKGVMVKSRES